MLSTVHAYAFVMTLLQAESRRLLRGTMIWAQTVSLLQGRIPLKGTWEETRGSRAAGMKVRTCLLCLYLCTILVQGCHDIDLFWH